MKNIHCKYLLLTIVVLALHSCGTNEIYKVGNRITLDYPVETKMSLKIVRRYLDTLIKNEGYQVPDKWFQYNKLVDIDSANTKRLYFNTSPEEMYLIQFNGMLLLADVYNEDIVKGDWVATPDRMPLEEKLRINKRFEQMLDKIEKMAKENNVPDSVLYFKPI